MTPTAIATRGDRIQRTLDSHHIQYAHPNTVSKHIHTNVHTVEDFGRHTPGW